MGFKELLQKWDDELGSDWSESKLLSRKWGFVILSSVVVVGLDVAGRALQDQTVSYLRDIGVAIIGMQGFIDMLKYRAVKRKRKPKKDGDE
jgi:hypothetical protein